MDVACQSSPQSSISLDPPERVGFAGAVIARRQCWWLWPLSSISRSGSLNAPLPGTLPGIGLRSFQGPSDIPVWLELRHRAFARATPGVLHWTPADFASEFLEKPWWSPERIWFATVPDPAAVDRRPLMPSRRRRAAGRWHGGFGRPGHGDRGSAGRTLAGRAAHLAAAWRGPAVGRSPRRALLAARAPRDLSGNARGLDGRTAAV